MSVVMSWDAKSVRSSIFRHFWFWNYYTPNSYILSVLINRSILHLLPLHSPPLPFSTTGASAFFSIANSSWVFLVLEGKVVIFFNFFGNWVLNSMLSSSLIDFWWICWSGFFLSVLIVSILAQLVFLFLVF